MQACAIALILMLDASASVSAQDWSSQVNYTADALAHPTVQGAIESLPGGAAVSVMVFASKTTVAVPWTVLSAKLDISTFVEKMKETPKTGVGVYTFLEPAIDAVFKHMEKIPCDPETKVVDISTDGVVTNLAGVERKRDEAVEKNIKINAIGFGPFGELNAFLENTLKTPDGFAMVAETWEDYALAIRRKLLREIASR